MTKLLEVAIKKVQQLPEKEQNLIAAFILDEIVWDYAIDASKPKLSAKAKKALKESGEGQTTELIF